MKNLVFILIIFLCSCSPVITENVSKKISFVPVSVKDSTISFKELADLCEIIPLENVKEGMLSDVQKVCVTDSSIFIYDDAGIPAVIKFDSKGKYICNVGRVGHAKNEYDYIDDFTVNEQNGTVVVLTKGNIAMVYDLSGKYLYSKVLGESKSLYFSKIESVADGYVCFLGYNGQENGYLLHFFDKNFDLVSCRLQQDPNKIPNHSYILNPIRGCGNTVCYFDFYKQTINLLPFDNSDQCRTIQLTTDKMLGLNNVKDGSFSRNNIDFDLVDNIVCLEDKAYLRICVDRCAYFTEVDYDSDVVRVYMGAMLPDLETYRAGYLYSVLSPGQLLSFYEKMPLAPYDLVKAVRSKSKDFIDDFSELSNFVILKMKPKQ